MAESLKEIAIKDYLAKINFKNDDWKISEMQEGMRTFLGEAPGIDIEWSKSLLVLEDKNGESYSTEELIPKKITIVFLDLNDSFKKMEILI